MYVCMYLIRKCKIPIELLAELVHAHAVVVERGGLPDAAGDLYKTRANSIAHLTLFKSALKPSTLTTLYNMTCCLKRIGCAGDLLVAPAQDGLDGRRLFC